MQEQTAGAAVSTDKPREETGTDPQTGKKSGSDLPSPPPGGKKKKDLEPPDAAPSNGKKAETDLRRPAAR